MSFLILSLVKREYRMILIAAGGSTKADWML